MPPPAAPPSPPSAVLLARLGDAQLLWDKMLTGLGLLVSSLSRLTSFKELNIFVVIKSEAEEGIDVRVVLVG